MRGKRSGGLCSSAVVLVVLWGSLCSAFAAGLEDVQQAAEMANARWNVGRTSVSELPDEDKRLLASLVLTGENRGALESGRELGALPSRWNWAEMNGVSPVTDQRQCGSCWAFASIAAMESLAMIEQGVIPAPDYSEQFMISYNVRNYGCDGGVLRYAYDFLKHFGSVSEDCLEYRARDGWLPPPCSQWQDQLTRISAWSWVAQSVDAIKAAVYVQPVPVGFYVYDDFYYYQGGVYEHVFGAMSGGHGVLVVGWDDAEQCFIVKNSWGEDWGEDGYFRIAYSQVTNEVSFGLDSGAFDGVELP